MSRSPALTPASCSPSRAEPVGALRLDDPVNHIPVDRFEFLPSQKAAASPTRESGSDPYLTVATGSYWVALLSSCRIAPADSSNTALVDYVRRVFGVEARDRRASRKVMSSAGSDRCGSVTRRRHESVASFERKLCYKL